MRRENDSDKSITNCNYSQIQERKTAPDNVCAAGDPVLAASQGGL